MRIRSFPPLARGDARVLVLGSMPGVVSLRAGQYYAHPRNQFWPIMGRLLGAGSELDYGERLARLAAAGVALWDVLAQCERPGSLDARIAVTDALPNDFAALFHRCPEIHSVFFNGRLAERAYRRLVLPQLRLKRELRYRCLPSTSPAHAALDPPAKLRRWRVVARAARQPGTFR